MSLITLHRMENSTDKDIVGGVLPTWTASTSFAAGKFGNGAQFDADKQADFGTITTGTAFWVSFYWIPAYTPAGIPNGAILLNNQIGTTYVSCFYYNPYGGFNVDFRNNTIYRFTNNTWAANDKIHIGLQFDPSAGAGNRIKMWQNNVALTNSSIPVEASWAFTSNQFIFSDDTLGGWNAHGVIDNVKIGSGIKTDWLDHMNIERSGMNDQIIIT